jgi:hypothetical protein
LAGMASRLESRLQSRVAGRVAGRERPRPQPTHFLARRTAVGTSAPFASSAAMAEARLQPVPCVLPVLQGAGTQAGETPQG